MHTPWGAADQTSVLNYIAQLLPHNALQQTTTGLSLLISPLP